MSLCLQKHFQLHVCHSLNIVTHTDDHDAAQEGHFEDNIGHRWDEAHPKSAGKCVEI